MSGQRAANLRDVPLTEGFGPLDLAAVAGVARPTVFTAVGGKSIILKDVVDRALAGDDEPVPVSRRPWFRAMIDEPDPARMLHLHAGNFTRVYRRVGAVYCAVEAAANADPDVADLWRTLQLQRLAEPARWLPRSSRKECCGRDTTWTRWPTFSGRWRHRWSTAGRSNPAGAPDGSRSGSATCSAGSSSTEGHAPMVMGRARLVLVSDAATRRAIHDHARGAVDTTAPTADPAASDTRTAVGLGRVRGG